MKTLKTGVKVTQKGKRIEVNSPYWVERKKENKTAQQLADFAVVMLATLILIAILWS